MLRRARPSLAARVYHVDMRKVNWWVRLIGRVQLGVALILVAAGFAATWVNVALGIGGSLVIWFVGEELGSSSR